MIDDHLLVRVQPLQDLASLPVPEHHVTLTVSARNETAVWREPDRTSVTSNGVPGKSLFPVLTEAVGRIDKNLVVQGLSREPFFCKQINE